MKRTSLLKNIYKHGNRYYIHKSINGKRHHFGTFATLDEAVKHRDKVKANGWKQVPLTEEQQDEVNAFEYFKCISIDTYKTQYRVNCRSQYRGCVKTIEEALYFRDMIVNGETTKKPYELDLITDNPYIEHGLKFPLPERLIMPERNTKHGKGSIIQCGPTSFRVQYGGNNNGSRTFDYSCPTYEMAEYVRREMMKCGWDKSKLEEIVENYPKYYTYLMYFYQYITKNKDKNREWTGKYDIVPPVRMNDNKLEHIIYNNLEDALYERDFLRDNDWNYDLLVETIDDRENPYYDMELPPYPTRRIRNVKKRDFHEKELSEIIELCKQGYNQTTICEITGYPVANIKNWLKRGYDTTWSEFVELINDGINPLEVLEKQEIIYQPDLSRAKPSNFNNYVSRKSDQYGLRWVVQRKDVYYGCYPSKELAHKISKDLAKANWDKSKLKDIQAKHEFTSMVNSRRWVYSNGHSWMVRRKNKQKKMLYYGCWKDKRIAESVRDMLMIYGWKPENMEWIGPIAEWTVHCRDLYNSSMFGGASFEDIAYIERCEAEDKHYYLNHGKYQVRKNINNKFVSFGRYKTEAKAIEVVEFLENNNWDKELLNVMKELGEI